MTVLFTDFPLASIVDLLTSYIQWVFTNDELTPDSYRWSTIDRDSKIRISGTFVIDNEKPMSQPFVVVERGGFTFANGTIDNLKSADPNTFENDKYADWADGPVNIIVGSEVASEASCIANFLAVMIQADRHGIIKNSGFVRNLNYIGVGPEMPVIKDSEVRRWEVTLSIQASLQMSWFKTTREPILWNASEFFMIERPPEVFSDQGETVEGSDLFVDTTQDFGILDSSSPKLIQQDLERGWYYVRFRDNENKQLYTITEIVDNNTLRLQTHDEDGDPIPWEALEDATELEYDLFWNSLHIHMKLPTQED